MKCFKAIAAMAQNRVIGSGHRIPWHLPEDFRWFKKTTVGNVVVMGRKTFESIGKPLPNRETIILSRSGFEYPGIRIIQSLSELNPTTESRDIFICGGAQVYEMALPYCSELYLTRVKREVQGDVFFPPFEHLFEPESEILNNPDFKVVRYVNRTPKQFS